MNINIVKTELKLGAAAPFKLLHVTDSHIALDDPGEDFGRFQFFSNAEQYFIEMAQYARENNMPMLHTGDFLDFTSRANLDFLDKHLAPLDYMYAAGNHDFCHRVGFAREDHQYKLDQMKLTAPHIRSNLYFDSRVINGVNIITLDNSYYLIREGQIDLLRAEAAKGLPMILAMHNPLFTKEYADMILEEGNPCAYLCGAPEEYTSKYPEDRRLQQTPDEATLNAIEYILGEPLIKAVIVGHTHRNYECMLPNGIPQITTSGGYKGYAREITVI